MTNKDYAKSFYKKTLRFLKFNKIQSKERIKQEIKEELDWVKNQKGKKPEFKPVISIEEYMQKI